MSRTKIGEVMGVEVLRGEDGDIRLGSQVMLLAGEDPVQFCDELKALLTKKPAAEQLVDDLFALVAQEKRLYPRTKLVDLLEDYHTARRSEVSE